MTYSIIIPTMYYYPEPLQRLIDQFEECSMVKEIIVINNCPEQAVELIGSKVRVIGLGKNLFVNPSWRWGAIHSCCPNLVFVNDDMKINGDLNRLFDFVSEFGLKGKVIGPAVNCYRKNKESIQIAKAIGLMTDGFGCLLMMNRDDYLLHSIPKGIKVWFGDTILYHLFDPYYFKGLEIDTRFVGTTKKLNLSGVNRRERMLFNQKEWKRN